MDTLMQDGNVIGPISNFRIIPGRQAMIRVGGIGGESKLIPGRKDSDRCSFSFNGLLTTGDGFHDVVLEEGKTYKVLIDKVRGGSPTTYMEGIIVT